MYMYRHTWRIPQNCHLLLQTLVQELRITNQVMYLSPPVEQVRQHLTEELFSWEESILKLPRIQHSRYQVILVYNHFHKSTSKYVRKVFIQLKQMYNSLQNFLLGDSTTRIRTDHNLQEPSAQAAGQHGTGQGL